ncbi:MAG: phage tail protein [Gammaproteobacteria bacterium]|nr:phage tail protein [Gammaproteobacteria bacterium]
MSVIAAVVGLSAYIGGATILTAVMLGASIKYQQYKQQKALDAMEAAADEAKGFEVVTEGEIDSVKLVYGRAKIGGTRVLHRLKSNYVYAAPALGGEVFVTEGDTRLASSVDSVPVLGTIKVISNTTSFNGAVDGTWDSDNETITQLTVSSEISRSSPTGPFTVTTEVGKAAIFGSAYVAVKIGHTPFDTYGDWSVEEGNAEEPIATVFNYRVDSYNNTTGLLTLKFHSATNPEYLSGTRTASLSANKNGSKNEFLFINQVICHKGISAVHSIDIDGRDFRHPDFGASGRIHVYRDGGIGDPMLNANITGQAASLFPETAYASMVFKLNRDEPQYRGIPEVVFYVDGFELSRIDESLGVYTKSSTKYSSNNPVYVLLDYLTAEYGRNLDISKIDLASFHAAAQLCEKQVDAGSLEDIDINGALWNEKVKTTGTRNIKLYECNLVLDTADDFRSNVNKILGSIPEAHFMWSDGTYKISLKYPEVWSAGTWPAGSIVQYETGGVIDLYRSTVSTIEVPGAGVEWETGPDPQLVSAYLTDDDIILENEITMSWPDLSSRLNYCTITFVNESKDFEKDTVSWPNRYGPGLTTVYDTYLAEDNGIELETSKSPHGITTEYHATAYAEMIVRKSRHAHVLGMTVTNEFMYLEPGDVIHLNSTELKVPSEIYLIDSLKVSAQGNIDIQLTKFDARILAWNAKDMEVVSKRSIYSGDLPQVTGLAYTPPAPGKATLTGGNLTWDPSTYKTALKYNAYIAGGPADIQDFNTVWEFLGSSTSNSLTMPPFTPGRYTLTVVAEALSGKVPPVYNLTTGSRWPLLTVDIADSLLGGNQFALTLYKYSTTDLTGTSVEGGSFDFTNHVTTPPVGYYVSEGVARENATDPLQPGDLYVSTAVASVNHPATIDISLAWTALELFDPKTTQKTIKFYARVPAAEPNPSAPSGGSYLFPEGPVTPPSSALASGSYTGKSFSVATQINGSPTDLASAIISVDGLHMYVSNNDGSIFEYDLSEPFDVSSATYTSRTIRFATTLGTSQYTSLALSPDGSKIFGNNASTKKIHSFSFGTNFDISTLTEDAGSLSVLTQFGANGFINYVINSTGTRVFALHTLSPFRIHQYNLSTPWDLSTGVYAATYISAVTNTTQGLAISSDDTKLYVGDNTTKTILELSISASGDVTTCSLTGAATDFSDTNVYVVDFTFANETLIVCGAAIPYFIYQYASSIEWATEDPGTEGSSWITEASFSRMGSYGINTNTPAYLAPVLAHSPGTQVTKQRVYQWSTVAPTFLPNAQTTYNWLNGTQGNATNMGSWTLGVTASPGGVGIRLWVAEISTSAPNGTVSTTLAWDTGNPNIYAGDITNLPDGKTQVVSIYRWDTAIPTIVGSSTYTWETDILSVIPTGWSDTIPATVSGYTLYEARITLVDIKEAVTTSVDWSAAKRLAINYAGGEGINARRAYVSTVQINSDESLVLSSGTGSLPDSEAWDFTGVTWSDTLPTAGAGEVVYQSDGMYDENTTNVTWSPPYVAAFKVGDLSAISASMGTLNVTSSLTMQNSGVIKSEDATSLVAGAGLWMSGGTSAQSEFRVGDPAASNYLAWSPALGVQARGAGLSINGAAGAISLNDETFGNKGVQLEYNVGSPRIYIGNGEGSSISYENNALTLGAGVHIDGADSISAVSNFYRSHDCTDTVGWGTFLGGPTLTQFDYGWRVTIPNTDTAEFWVYNTRLFLNNTAQWGSDRKVYFDISLAPTPTEPNLRMEIGMGYMRTNVVYRNGVWFSIIYDDTSPIAVRGVCYRWGVPTYTAAMPFDIMDPSRSDRIQFFIDYKPSINVCDFYINGIYQDSLPMGSGDRPTTENSSETYMAGLRTYNAGTLTGLLNRNFFITQIKWWVALTGGAFAGYPR